MLLELSMGPVSMMSISIRLKINRGASLVCENIEWFLLVYTPVTNGNGWGLVVIPGADITDYFNYGFNEHTWRAYCAKQKQMREEQHLRKRINVRQFLLALVKKLNMRVMHLVI